MTRRPPSDSFAFDTAYGLPIDHDRRAFRSALGRYPTGVAVVTALGADGRRIGITINSFASVSLDPPLVLWSIEEQAATREAFVAADYFAISILAHEQEDVARQFAMPLGDRFKGLHVYEGLGGIPLFDEALSVFECRRFAVYPGGDHQIILGQVERVSTRPGAPLVFHEGLFLGLH